MTDRNVIAVVEQVLDPPLILNDDLRPLRDRFAALTDDMLRELQSRRLDLDDCVLERRATVVADSGTEQSIPVDSLTDRRWLFKSFIDNNLDAQGATPDTTALRMTAIALRAVRAPDYPQTPPRSS